MFLTFNVLISDMQLCALGTTFKRAVLRIVLNLFFLLRFLGLIFEVVANLRIAEKLFHGGRRCYF